MQRTIRERGVRDQQWAVPAWVRLARVFHKLDHALVAQLRAHGLSLAQFDVLIQTGRHEGLTQQELADRLLVTKGNVCQLLDRMEDAGLLERRQEGRANRLALTDAGRRLYAEIVPEHEAEIARLLAPLARDEQRQLAALLRKLDSALES
ncbi:MAG: MarR family winged helix-turn-helix transcriptional regulator [Ktedonobacterales bacterium]|jgi:DNA-binding MarR family transcriptional regulator